MPISVPNLMLSATNVDSGAAQAIVNNASPAGALVIVCALSFGSSGAIFSGCSDSQGNVYQQAVQSGLAAAGTGSTAIFFCPNAKALAITTDSFTLTANAPHFLGLIAFYVTGADQNNPHDSNADVTYASAVTESSVTMSTTGTLADPGDLLVWAGSNAPTNWNNLAISDGAGTIHQIGTASGIGAGWQLPNSTSPETVAFTWTNAAEITAALTAFRTPIPGGNVGLIGIASCEG